jgi:hypothetical protein
MALTCGFVCRLIEDSGHLQTWRISRYANEALMAPDRRSYRDAHLAQNRTSRRLNPTYEPDKFTLLALPRLGSGRSDSSTSMST